jgi:hypothetical protein
VVNVVFMNKNYTNVSSTVISTGLFQCYINFVISTVYLQIKHHRCNIRKICRYNIRNNSLSVDNILDITVSNFK